MAFRGQQGISPWTQVKIMNKTIAQDWGANWRDGIYNEVKREPKLHKS